MAAPDTDPDREARAEAMRPVAIELVARLRYEHPDVLYRDLIARLTPAQVVDLLFIVAGAPDPNATATEWWGWAWVQLTCGRPEPATEAVDVEAAEDDSVDHMTNTELDEFLVRLAEAGKNNTQIGDEAQMSPCSVGRNLVRIRQGRGATEPGREPVGAGVAA